MNVEHKNDFDLKISKEYVHALQTQKLRNSPHVTCAQFDRLDACSEKFRAENNPDNKPETCMRFCNFLFSD